MKRPKKPNRSDKQAQSLRYGIGAKRISEKDRRAIERQDVGVSNKESYTYVAA